MGVQPSIAAGVSGYNQRLGINAGFASTYAAMQTQDANAATTTGTSPSFILTLSPAPGALALFLNPCVKFHAAGGASNTLNINGLGAVALKQYDGGGNKIPFVPFLGQIVSMVFDGTDLVVGAASSSGASHGACILTLSGGSLVLKPWKGNGLIINGATCTIPSAGVSLAATGLTAGTLYFVYAYMNSGTMTLEASTTTHTMGADGVEVKSGATNRTLVGMVRPVAGPAFSATQNCMLVRSWFNRTAAERRPRSLQASEISRNNDNYAEVGTTTRVEFLVWSDEGVNLSGFPCVKGSAAINGYAKLMLDGADILYFRSTFERFVAGTSYLYQIFGGSGTYKAASLPTIAPLEKLPFVLTEGYHYTSIQINGGPGYLDADSAKAYGNTEIVIE